MCLLISYWVHVPHSSNATYEDILGNNKPFPQPIPLRVWFSELYSSIIDILVIHYKLK